MNFVVRVDEIRFRDFKMKGFNSIIIIQQCACVYCCCMLDVVWNYILKRIKLLNSIQSTKHYKNY